MTTSNAIKYTLLFPVLYFAFGILVNSNKRFEPEFFETLLFLIIGCAVLWVLGIFFGVIISALFKSPKREFYFYFAGQSLVLLFMMGAVVFDIFSKHEHEKRFGNIEHNRSFLFLNRDGEVDEYTNPLYVKIGFNRLEAEYQNNNDFRLTDFFSFYRDSTNGTYTDTLHILYFTYLTKDDQELFSKVHVFEGKATLQMFNEIILTNQEFIQARRENWKIKEQKEKEVTEMLKELKEAMKKDSSLK